MCGPPAPFLDDKHPRCKVPYVSRCGRDMGRPLNALQVTVRKWLLAWLERIDVIRRLHKCPLFLRLC